MKTLLIATLLIAGVSIIAARDASAAAANGTPIAKALTEANATQAEPVACRSVRVCQKPYGCRKVRRCF